MQLSIHYYVLSLSEAMSRSYEGIRDKLMQNDNGKFQFEVSNLDNPDSPLFIEEDCHAKGCMHITDRSLIISQHVEIWA